MNAANLYTRKIKGLDYRVWVSMLITWLVCLALFGYRQIKSSSTKAAPCATHLFIAVNGKKATNDAVCYLNQMALFRINTAPGAKVEWDFGDGSNPVEGSIAPHTFHSESTFTVKATVDGHCKYVQDIVVKLAPVAPAETTEIKIYADSNKISAGSQVRFFCASNIREEAYEWRVEGTTQVQTTPTATFLFPTPGVFIVKLMLNNDPSKVKTHQIEVTDIPVSFPSGNTSPGSGGGGNPVVPTELLKDDENPFNQGQKKAGPGPAQNNSGEAGQEPPKPEPPKPIEIDPGTFKTMLQSVLNREKDVSELYPYLDYKESTFVQKEGKDEQIKLPVFCRKNEERNIETLSFQRDNKNGIQVIKVKLKRRGPFGILGD